MMEEQDSRRISSSNNNTDSVIVDRISALPDCILGHILSFLCTWEAVRTCLLSKRWKFLWLDVHSLDFWYLNIFEEDSAENTAFIRFVDSVLDLTDDGRQLNKFCLTWFSAIPSHLVYWIKKAILRNVHEFEISCLGDATDPLQFPISHLNCGSLRYLYLKVTTIVTFVYDTADVCLPRLETLILDRAHFSSKEAFEKLIDGCPVLHHLEILLLYNYSDYDAQEDIIMHQVSSPSLTYLKIEFANPCTLKLMVPSLEYLKLEGDMSEVFLEKSLSSLVTADLDIVVFDEHYEHDYPANLIVGIVHALEHAKFLILSADVMKALGLATTSLSTKFKRLEKLEVTTDCCCYLQDFVHSSENLEELVIYKAYRRRTSDVPHDHSRWTAPVVVPGCLSKTLKKVELIGYSGLEDQRETIRFMLEHGTALEVVQICYKGLVGEKSLKEIFEFPRKSPACKVSCTLDDL